MSVEAMKQALEALEIEQGAHAYLQLGKADHIEEAITTLRAAIEQAESVEPVAYLCENAVGHKYFRWKKPSSTYKPIALYATPPAAQRQPLTDEQIRDLWSWSATAEAERTATTQQHAFTRAIEAAHGIGEKT